MERIAFNKAVARKAREMENFYKRKTRNLKAKYAKQNRLANLPRIKTVYINSSYINPVSLFPVPSGIVVYKVRDPKTGRIDYYAKDTFWKLMIKASNIKNNHNLMMASPRRALFPNPVTRVGITTRNIQRVIAKPKPKTPTRSAAARRIQSAFRKRVAARKSH
jgi:hypothetical protein